MCVCARVSASAFIQGRIWPSKWLHTKIHFMLYQLHFGREILEGISNAISCNKTMHGTAATSKFTPPKKNTFIH